MIVCDGVVQWVIKYVSRHVSFCSNASFNVSGNRSFSRQKFASLATHRHLQSKEMLILVFTVPQSTQVFEFTQCTCFISFIY